MMKQYLCVEDEEERMVWSGLSSPLQHILYVEELLGRRQKTHFNNERKHEL